MEAESHHRGNGGQAQEEEGVAQVGVEHVVHLANILGVALAGFGQAESVFEVADDAVTRFLEDHDEHGDENQIELLLRDQLKSEQPDGGVRSLALECGQRATVGAQLRFDEREGQDGVNAEE